MPKSYNFTRSDIKMLLLSLLSKADMYGYQLIQELKEMSNDYFLLKEGSLYPLLHSLEKDELIQSYWENTESKRKKKYYHLTKKGEKALNKEKDDWKRYSSCINNILGGDSIENRRIHTNNM